jgi:hypothetical protein
VLKSDAAIYLVKGREMQNLLRRLKALEQVHLVHDGPFTLEQLCRTMWRQGRAHYVKGAEEGNWVLRRFVAQFELEDADRLPR